MQISWQAQCFTHFYLCMPTNALDRKPKLTMTCLMCLACALFQAAPIGAAMWFLHLLFFPFALCWQHLLESEFLRVSCNVSSIRVSRESVTRKRIATAFWHCEGLPQEPLHPGLKRMVHSSPGFLSGSKETLQVPAGLQGASGVQMWSRRESKT